MSTIRTSNFRRSADHFEPEVDDDPHAQRRLRGQLEQIDYAAFAANKAVIGATLTHADGERFQRLAVATAQARARWLAESLAMSDAGQELSAEQVARLTRLRQAYDELTEAYDGLRRLIERGYLSYRPAAPR